jgi:hypothetical protein
VGVRGVLVIGESDVMRIKDLSVLSFMAYHLSVALNTATMDVPSQKIAKLLSRVIFVTLVTYGANLMDIVIPYTRKTKWNELIYALRSIQSNLLDAGDLIIVGDDPEGITPDRFIPLRDTLPCKEHRILAKTLAGCKATTGRFVFTNDDIYFLKPMYCKEIGYYRTGLLQDRRALHPYRICLENTRKALALRGLPEFCYEIHTAIVFDRERFEDIMAEYEFVGQYTLTMRSLYANTARVMGEDMTDTKDVLDPDAMFFSTGDNVTDSVKRWLMNRFPEKSRWED